MIGRGYTCPTCHRSWLTFGFEGCTEVCPYCASGEAIESAANGGILRAPKKRPRTVATAGGLARKVGPPMHHEHLTRARARTSSGAI